MLELVATMFLGLLLKIETGNVLEQERSRVFDTTVAAVTMFVFVYPVVTLLLTSEKLHNMLVPRITKLASKVADRLRRKENTMAPARTGASDVGNAAGAAPNGGNRVASTNSTTDASQAVALGKSNRVTPDQRGGWLA